MIPARFGSQRLKLKNLALINGKPLIYYAIQAALESKLFYKIVLNSDNEIFKKIADKYNIDFYLRPKKFGSSKTSSDEVIYDFIKKYQSADFISWINPIAPLQTSKDIIDCTKYFNKEKLDSLITVNEYSLHGMYKKSPINYNKFNKFARTQDLNKIELFLYSTMIWKCETFLAAYKKRKSAIFCGKFSTFPIPRERSLLIKNQEDLKLANLIFYSQNNKKFENKLKLRYDSIIKKI